MQANAQSHDFRRSMWSLTDVTVNWRPWPEKTDKFYSSSLNGPVELPDQYVFPSNAHSYYVLWVYALRIDWLIDHLALSKLRPLTVPSTHIDIAARLVMDLAFGCLLTLNVGMSELQMLG